MSDFWARAMTIGLSAQAIAGNGVDHPLDPADLLRCIKYCRYAEITTEQLRESMAGRSESWDLLLPEWDHLVALLEHEMATVTDGRARRTYQEMKRILADGVTCTSCGGSGRGALCEFCRGTGRRGSGQCRAAGCYRGVSLCSTCRGRGYTEKEKP